MDSFVHFRRCHVCGKTSEAHNQFVKKCDHCGKHLAPFYYFDETKMEALQGDGVQISQKELSAESHEEYYHPIWGLTCLW